MDTIHISKMIIFYSLALILLYYVFSLFQIYKLFLYIFFLFFPLLIALFIHFLLEPVIDYFLSDRIKRKFVVMNLYLFITLFFIVCVYLIAPYFINQCLRVYHLYQEGDFYLHPIFITIIDFLNQYQILEDLMGVLNGWTKSVFFWVSHVLIGIGISFYLSYDNLHLIEKMIIYLPFEKQGIFMQSLKKFKLVTYQFMKSLLIDFLFFFSTCLIVFFFIDKELFVWIALLLAMTNLIPYIGPFIGGIPLVLYEFIKSPQLGYISFFVIIILQYVESTYVQPYLYSKSIKIHPIALFISLTFFGDLFGIIGMIFSPLFLVYTTLIYHLLKKVNVYKHIIGILNNKS